MVFDKLLLGVTLGKRDEDTLTTLAGRIAKLDREISRDDAKNLKDLAGGKTLAELSANLLRAIDPDVIAEQATGKSGTTPTEVPPEKFEAARQALVALVRFSLEQQPVLKPFAESVDERFNEWLMNKASAGIKFTPDQLAWLNLIRDHIATSLSIEPDDFEYAPFSQRGGLGKAHQIFGEHLPELLEELNEVLAA